MIFNGLIRYKPGDASQFEPDIATALPEPKMEGGKQVWTFSLRKGVMCQPSEGVASYELTSDDVAFSFKKAADQRNLGFLVGLHGYRRSGCGRLVPSR